MNDDDRDPPVRESEARLRQIFESSPIPMALMSVDGTFLDINQAGLDLHGFSSKEELLARNCLEFIDPDYRVQVERQWREVLCSGSVRNVELVQLHRDGGQIATLVSAIRIDIDGRPYGVLAVVQDVTEAKRNAHAAKSSTERLRMAAEASSLGTFEFNPVTGEHDWDALAREMWGIGADEPITWETFTSAIHPDDRADAEAANVRALDPRGDGVYACEYRVKNRRDGVERWIAATGRVSFAGGRAVRLLGTVQDISARKRTEMELARMRSVLAEGERIAHVGSWECNVQTRQTVWSDEQYRIYGLDPAGPSPAYDCLLAASIHPDDAPLVDRTFSAATEHGSTYELEHRIVRPDGGVRWVHDRAHPYFDRDGKVLRYFGATLDITERRQAEAALAESRDRFTYAVSAAREGVWDWNLETDEVWYSTRFKEMLGYSEDEVEHHLSAWSRLVHPDDRERTLDAVDAAVRGLRDYEIEFRMRHRDGHYVDILSQGLPIRRPADGKVARIVGTHLDLTDRKRAEQSLRETTAALEAVNARLQEADRRKDEFLAMLAHELRNPLAVIGSAGEILRRARDLAPDLRCAREAIERQARHMGRLIDDLLDVSRVTQGKIALKMERLDAATVVRHAVDSAASLVESRGQRLFLSLPRDGMPVDADPVRLTQVLWNLLNNAAKYTRPGGEIHVSAERREGAVEIRVRDNGIGIDAGLLPHVFDLFVQGDRTPDREQGGLGIGLTLARSLVEAHGGVIAAASDGIGTGSELTVMLPLAADHAPAEGAPSAASERTAPLRILVVDDNADAAEMMRLLLQLDGHEVATADHGAAGIDLALRWVPDVALVDLGMPGMDGFEVARRLRGQPALERTILVAVTGYGQEEHLQQSRDAGFHHHVTKSADFEPLRQLLGSVARREGAG